MTSSSASLPTASHVFVYGTLRRGDVRDINLLHPAPRFVGYAVVRGALYHLGSYPGVVLGGREGVKGEIYAISKELEIKLDEIEEVWPQQTGEYVKRVISVRLDEIHSRTLAAQEHGLGAEMFLDCIVYEISPHRIANQALIQSGDWHSIS